MPSGDDPLQPQGGGHRRQREINGVLRLVHLEAERLPGEGEGDEEGTLAQVGLEGVQQDVEEASEEQPAEDGGSPPLGEEEAGGVAEEEEAGGGVGRRDEVLRDLQPEVERLVGGVRQDGPQEDGEPSRSGGEDPAGGGGGGEVDGEIGDGSLLRIAG